MLLLRTLINYYMSAYVFDKNPPFKILGIVEKHLVFKGMYSEDPVKGKFVFFPAGVVEKDNEFIVSLGCNDISIYIISFDKKQLLNDMTGI